MPNIEREAVRVAVGVVSRATGEILIALRGKEKHQGNLWEFPGGKVEEGESVADALARELYEELNIIVRKARPLIEIRHSYSEVSVHLSVCEVREYSGEAISREGQAIQWVPLDKLSSYEFPAANRAILNALLLPRTIAVTDRVASTDDFRFRLERAIGRGAEGVYLRLKAERQNEARLCQIAEEICGKNSIPIFTNRELLPYFDGQVELHLRSCELASQESGTYRSRWVGASCHNPEEIAKAVSAGVDYIFLSPVCWTRSHAGTLPIGFDRFAEWVDAAPVPVFGLGGLTVAELERVRNLGGQGIAAIREFWE